MKWDANEHYKNVEVARAYDRSRFSSLPGRVFDHMERHTILKCFGKVPAGSTVVDVPCGTGRLAAALLERGYRVHGMDISAAMLAVAEEKLHGYQDRFSFEVADVKHAPARPDAYDAALCARVLMHFTLDEQVEFLTAVACLSSSIVVINHSLDSPYQRFRRRVKRLLGDRHDPARCPVSNADIKVLLQRAGLRELHRRRLFRLVSEAVYIVAEKIPLDKQTLRAEVNSSATAAP